MDITLTRAGRSFSTSRFLHQLGDEEAPVMFEPTVHHVSIARDTHKIVLNCTNDGDQGAFDAAITHSREAARRWLKARAGAEAFDFCGNPTCRIEGGVKNVQLIVRIAAKEVDKTLRASGVDAVFVRPFFEGTENVAKYKVIPFTAETDLAGAVRQAGRMHGHFGVIKTRKGYGVRVLPEDFEEAARAIRPDDAASFTGTRYEVSGLPLSCGREAIEDLLSTWTGAVPIATFTANRRRTWIVSAHSAPLHSKVRHEEGLAYIQVAAPRAQTARKPPIRFIPSARPTEEPSWLKSWAGKGRGETGGIPSAAMPAPVPATQKMQMAPSQPAAVAPLPVSPPAQDVPSMIREAMAEMMSSFSKAMASLDSRLGGLASEVAELQCSKLLRADSPSLKSGERREGRATSRSRGRVPVGKRL